MGLQVGFEMFPQEFTGLVTNDLHSSAGEMMSLESLTDKLVQALLLKSQPLKTSKGWLLAG